jgi:HK97 family phage prohead protease
MMDCPVYSAGLELRAAGDGSRRLSGKFPYMSLAVIDSGGQGRRPKKEQFAEGAFSYALEDAEREIHVLIGHSFDRPLASRKAKTLTLRDTKEALAFEAILTPEILETSWAKDFIAAFGAGLVGGVSPGFRVAPIEGAEATTEENPRHGKALIRTIRAAILFELSLVTRPAYHETDLALRNFQPPARGIIHPLNRWRP